MNIPIKTNKEKYHRQILELIRSLPPLNKLRPKELDLLAEIMKQYQEFADIPIDKRKYLVFSTANRVKMMETLKISSGNMNSYLVRIRRLKLLTKANDMASFLYIPYGKYDININLEVND